MAHVIIGTAGHIDHGKTALVKALTGIETDTLPEERDRGVTIDIGFCVLERQCDHYRCARARAVCEEYGDGGVYG